MPSRQLTTYQAVISQARAFRALKNYMSQVLTQHNLTVTEWLIIGTVIDAGPNGVRTSELAQTLGVEMPVVTNLIHKATASKWVVKIDDSTDKRAKRIVATPEGLEEACAIEGKLRSGAKNWLAGLDKQMLHGYFAVVKALAAKEHNA